MTNADLIFVSTNWAAPWGGSEVLWSKTALRLSQSGHKIAASVFRWPKLPSPIQELQSNGIRLHQRGWVPPDFLPAFCQKAIRWIGGRSAPVKFKQWLRAAAPALVCFSLGSPAEDPTPIEICRALGIPYVLLLQANTETIWPDDIRADRLRSLYLHASRLFFVSHRNHRLLENQLGVLLPLSEVVRNPCNLAHNANLTWPESQTARLACVGRLDPRAKGQDLLLRVLAEPAWRGRDFRVTFYGAGPMERTLAQLAESLGLSTKVAFAGHLSNVEAIWSQEHLLVLPSRYEGLPLAIVEAMLAARIVVTTDVADNTQFLENGKTGFIAEAATENHLSQTMELAWACRSQWEEMGLWARKSIRENFPEDPEGLFAHRLLDLAGLAPSSVGERFRRNVASTSSRVTANNSYAHVG